MKIVIAIDSFKGSLSSMDAGNAIASGIRRVYPEADILVRPLADGGEGTVDALVHGMGGQLREITVTGPLGMPVAASYGILPESRTALIETAAAAGLTLIPAPSRNPLVTTTYGIGEMIADAIGQGCRRFLIGLGGSATNDGGAGMLQALGYDFLGADGRPIPLGAQGLKDLKEIRTDQVLPALSECTFQIACDVDNPLCGPRGCSAVYAPQKGADAAMIAQMDQWLEQYAQLTAKIFPQADHTCPGTGAAGGLGFAFLSFTNATLQSGIRIVLEETRLEDHLAQADVVITGEGRLDGQTAMGKAPVGVAGLAGKYGIPVIAFAGSVTEDASACHARGIHAFFPILQGITTLEQAMLPENARRNLANTAEQVFRLWKVCRPENNPGENSSL